MTHGKKQKLLIFPLIFLSFLLILSSVPVFAAENENETKVCGDFEYKVVDGNAIITHCISREKAKIIIPETLDDYPVTELGEFTFRYCAVSSIEIPNSVTTIGRYAFISNPLKSIVIPDSVVSLGDSIFAHCKELKKVTLGKNVETIPPYAFNDCPKLKEVIIPEGVHYISDHAFLECSRLSSITLPESMIEIGTQAFDSTNLETVKIGKGIKIGDRAFAGCTKLKSVEIEELEDLEKVDYTNDIRIGDYAFLNCENLSSFSGGQSVQTIGTGAFQECNSLKEINLARIHPNWIFIYPRAFYHSGLTSIKIGAVREIDEKAFANCENLKKITFTSRPPEPFAEGDINKVAFHGVTADVYYSPDYYGWWDGWHGIPLLDYGGKLNWHSYSTREKDITNTSVSPVSDTTYDGTTKMPKPSVKDGSIRLKNRVDFYYSYGQNMKPGRAIVTIKGKGRYGNAKIIPFVIRPKAGSGLKATVNGSKVQLNWSKKYGADGYVLYDGSRRIAYVANNSFGTSANANKLQYTFTAPKGKHNYKVRAYVRVDGKNYGGGLSPAVSVTVK